jgi:hypothetical protein
LAVAGVDGVHLGGAGRQQGEGEATGRGTNVCCDPARHGMLNASMAAANLV